MPTKKKRAAQPSEKKLKQYRAILKKQGFVSKRTSLRGKVTPSQKRTISKFMDLLTGKATVVKAASKKQAAQFKKTGFQVKDEKIIVPKAKGERFTFNKKTGTLRSTRKVGGKKITKTIANGELGAIKPGQFYTVPFEGGLIKYRFSSLDTLITFMAPYEDKKHNPYKKWRSYVEIETIEDLEGEETYTPSKLHREKVKNKKLAPQKRYKRKRKNADA